MVPAVARAIKILRYVARQGDQGASLAQIHRVLGLHKSSCHTILKTLEHFGFLDYLPISKKYRLGNALSALGSPPEHMRPHSSFGMRLSPRRLRHGGGVR